MADFSYDWFSLLAALLLLITLILAIYACCNHFTANPSAVTSVVPRRPVPRVPPTSGSSSTSTGHRHRHRVEYHLELTNVSVPQDHVDPFTFLPPAYETLPKDPPKYEEIYFSQEGPSTGSGGEINTGFQPDVVTTPVNSEQASQPLDSRVVVIEDAAASNQSQTNSFVNSQLQANISESSNQSQVSTVTTL